VLQNTVVFGTVNANRRHYEVAAALVGADQAEGMQLRPDDVKTVIDFPCDGDSCGTGQWLAAG
jgi:hypothetical protein